jgi:hypothetical protein
MLSEVLVRIIGVPAWHYIQSIRQFNVPVAWAKPMLSVLLVFLSVGARAADHPASESSTQGVRQFNEVLDDLLDEYAYELKTSQVPLAVNVSLRKINLSDNIPASYEKYLETIISERIRQFSKSKVIQCTTCRVKQSIVKDGRVTVVVPINNKRALDQLAREYGIESWLDVGLIFQETSLIMALNLFDAKTKELLWSKIYNSESLYKKFPGGVPVPEGDRPATEAAGEHHSPTNYIFGASIGWSLVPNVNGSTNMLAVPLRFAEVFNKRRSEVGAQLVALLDTAVIIPNASPEPGVDVTKSDQVTKEKNTKVIKSFQYGLGIFATYHHNFLTSPESLDEMRPGAQVGLGLVAASSYLAFSAKLGMNVRLGRSLFVEADVLYSAPTTIELTDNFKFKTQGGVGALASFGIHL